MSKSKTQAKLDLLGAMRKQAVDEHEAKLRMIDEMIAKAEAEQSPKEAKAPRAPRKAKASAPGLPLGSPANTGEAAQ
jgi:hypothetical protein